MSGNIKKQMIVLSLEGCLSAGKSLLLTTLRCSSLVIKYAVFIVEEPVAEWQNVGGENLLELYYTDPARYAFDFQLHCVYTRLQAVRNVLAQTMTESRPILLILERSWHSDIECFASLHHQQGHINHIEMSLLRRLVSRETASLPSIDGIIMLDVSLQLAMRRLQARGRSGECAVQAAYLTQLMQEHDKWVNRMHISCIRVDGAALFQHQPVQHALIETIVNQIKAFIVLLNNPTLGKKHKSYTRSPVIFPKEVIFVSRSLLMPPVIESIKTGSTTTTLNHLNTTTSLTAPGNDNIIPFYVDAQPLTHQTTLHNPEQPLIKPNDVPHIIGTFDFLNFNLDEDWNTYQTGSHVSEIAVPLVSDQVVQTLPHTDNLMLLNTTKAPDMLLLITPSNNLLPLHTTTTNNPLPLHTTTTNNPLLLNTTTTNNPLSLDTPANNPLHTTTTNNTLDTPADNPLDTPANNPLDTPADNPLDTPANNPLHTTTTNNTLDTPANNPLDTPADNPMPVTMTLSNNQLPLDTPADNPLDTLADTALSNNQLPLDNTAPNNPLPDTTAPAGPNSCLITNGFGCDQEAQLTLPVISLCAVFEQTNVRWNMENVDVVTTDVILKPRKLRLCFCQ